MQAAGSGTIGQAGGAFSNTIVRNITDRSVAMLIARPAAAGKGGETASLWAGSGLWPCRKVVTVGS